MIARQRIDRMLNVAVFSLLAKWKIPIVFLRFTKFARDAIACWTIGSFGGYTGTGGA